MEVKKKKDDRSSTSAKATNRKRRRKIRINTEVLKPDKKALKDIAISKRNAKTIKLVAVIIVVLLLIILAAAQFGGVTFSTINDNIRTAIAGVGSGEGYPYRINGVEIWDADITNSDLILVYDDTVKVLDSTAKELSNLSHTYDHPVMSSNSGRALIYDVGAKSFRVQAKTRTLYEKEIHT